MGKYVNNIEKGYKILYIKSINILDGKGQRKEKLLWKKENQ